MTESGPVDSELDALVDSILQSRDRSAHTSRMTPRTSSSSSSHQHPQPNPTSSSLWMCSREPAGDNSRTTKMNSPVYALSSDVSRAKATHMDADGRENGKEDLNTLVEHILAGPGIGEPPSDSDSPPSRLPSASPTHVGSPGTGSKRRPGGATRVQRGDHGLFRISCSGTGSPESRVQAFARRLALWHERKEARRVQAVYEALEREQQECTFEPSINRLGVEVENSVAAAEGRPLYHRHDTDEELRRSSLSPKARGSGSRRAVPHASTIMSSSSSSSSQSASPLCDYIPSLQPLPQPINGVEAFVERLRRAHNEREALQEAEEAKRLHYYDPTTFRRDFTEPVPFELSQRRPRCHCGEREASSSLPYAVTVGGSPSRGPGGRSNFVGKSPPPLSGRAAARPTCRDAGERQPSPPGEEFYEMNTDTRLRAENTFLTLAPYIRQTLLFDRQMEAQLRRATDW
ncbi:hypothetical protein JKF63_06706 [Porcisia hertigi]|uniref:Uncharacterized protein n=1 Tax=Porcisia hertigi TaxID=2761500 RepID=A0A836IWW6_9TRYP|nr:hypothetical protein JKF63_06706 [Porcisia hertigi]